MSSERPSVWRAKKKIDCACSRSTTEDTDRSRGHEREEEHAAPPPSPIAPEAVPCAPPWEQDAVIVLPGQYYAEPNPETDKLQKRLQVADHAFKTTISVFKAAVHWTRSQRPETTLVVGAVAGAVATAALGAAPSIALLLCMPKISLNYVSSSKNKE